MQQCFPLDIQCVNGNARDMQKKRLGFIFRFVLMHNLSNSSGGTGVLYMKKGYIGYPLFYAQFFGLIV